MDKLRYDPVYQIEKLIEESRKQVDQSGLSCRGFLLANMFVQIKDQLISYIENAEQMLKTNLSAEDQTYWRFNVVYYKQQFDFVDQDYKILIGDDNYLKELINSNNLKLKQLQNKQYNTSTNELFTRKITLYGQFLECYKFFTQSMMININIS